MPFTTLFQARLDPNSGVLDYCNAGHPPALLRRANGDLEHLSDGGAVPGFFPDEEFIQGRAQLRPGDTLVMYSDGLLDTADRSSEQFGHVRWEELVRSVERADAAATLLSLLSAVQDFAGCTPLQDDMTLVVIRCA